MFLITDDYLEKEAPVAREIALPEHFSRRVFEYKNGNERRRKMDTVSRVSRSSKVRVIIFRKFLSTVVAILSSHLN